MSKVSQGRRLIDLLLRRGYTTMELQMTGISSCWHKRCREALRKDEHLIATKNAAGLNVYRVIIKAPYWPT